jgi:hypothetical protein
VGRGEARAYPALLDPRAGAARDERHDRRLRLTVRCALATPGPCNATVRLTWRRRGRTVQLASLERALVQGRRNFALELPAASHEASAAPAATASRSRHASDCATRRATTWCGPRASASGRVAERDAAVRAKVLDALQAQA